MAREVVDAVVIGAGPNGLVAANLLADAGWSVLVLQEQPEPGGAVRSGEVTAPGFVSDLYSSYYPLGFASPVIGGLGLEEHGLRWRATRRRCSRTRCRTAGPRCSAGTSRSPRPERESFGKGDGAAWSGWPRSGSGCPRRWCRR